MSKQFRFYLLPSDVTQLLSLLDQAEGLKIYSKVSQKSTLSIIPLTAVEELIGVRNPMTLCLTSIDDARISSNFYPTRDCWIIDSISECIEFSPCEQIGSVLVRGRFYFQNDMLTGDTIWKKRDAFLQWADRCFARAKRSLNYSKVLRAYIGEDALVWQQNGGTFTEIFIPGTRTNSMKVS